jgi:ATP-dependent helicase YprA (DUF1998 family)
LTRVAAAPNIDSRGEKVEVFDLRERLVGDYADYTRSFISIRDERIRDLVESELDSGLLWPEPIVQLNPSFEAGEWIDELAAEGVLHEECRRVFRLGKAAGDEKALRLHRHQAEAVRTARTGANYVLTTGTGSGKSLAYIVPIVDHVLRRGSGKGIQAIVVYPMNALANSQAGELEKFLKAGYPDGKGPVTFRRYTGQESEDERREIIASPPDILLTNYVMLELILTRPFERKLVEAARGLKFLVLDELHTYRGRQGADVALLARRVREACEAAELQCVGTSATLAGAGTLEEQRVGVARVASLLFGSEVSADSVIGETLERATPPPRTDSVDFRSALRERIEDGGWAPPEEYKAFVADPLSSWVESAFGLTEESGSGRLVRATPRPITGEEGAAAELAKLVGSDSEGAIAAIRKSLLAGFRCAKPETGFPVFAFRLHQFFSRGETVYASLEPAAVRHVTTQPQQFVPGDRRRILLPLAFCRECGQEYYAVRRELDPAGSRAFEPRDLGDLFVDEKTQIGFLYASEENPWPDEGDELLDRLPDEWVEEGPDGRRVKGDYRKYVPLPTLLSPDGDEALGGDFRCQFVPAPFRFCLACGVSYSGRQTRDFGKLTTLGAGGRSSATTILGLTAVRSLRADDTLPERARKLLSFSDNRQDASLQAGHFNDFVEVGLLRSGLHKAAGDSPDGLRHDDLTQKVFDVLALPVELYASDPDVRFAAREETDRALRDALGYRLYRDLERGWRVTAPNLEQTGLLRIEYVSLDELAASDDVWADKHEALAGASTEQRERIAKVLLDFMRRELAIKVDYLDSAYQEGLRQRSSQRLRPPWAIDEEERLEHAAILYPRPRRRAEEYRGHVYLSARGGFGQFLRRRTTFPSFAGTLRLDDTDAIIPDLLEALRIAGLVTVADEPREEGQVRGYQVPAAAMRWLAGDGTAAFHDPIRVPRPSSEGGAPNRFFVDFYRGVAADGKGLEAREHTAQVPAEERQLREERFRAGTLPVLFCSPTMELGVDISDLNVVNMRNVPPTPANYAQRSGRAGRSGQPALVFNYCSSGSSHDQYFFRRPELMVSGQVRPPRLDLTNEDLLTAHVHAVWLAETRQDLGRSLGDVLEIEGDPPSLELHESVREAIEREQVRERALRRSRQLLDTIPGLDEAEWYSSEWLDKTLTNTPLAFDEAAERWRGLYRAALATQAAQNAIATDASRSQREREMARRLRAEAEAQLDLLRGSTGESLFQSDFYSYRYFASEGFLPGYNFPRLPLSAYVPGRRGAAGRDEFLSRPRFLAISEFGPRSVIYHEGSRYLINKVILPVARTEENRLVTYAVKQCGACGYLHPLVNNGQGPDFCEHCGTPLPAPIERLFRLQNVATRRRDRINSDEEERLRQGFEIRSGVRFAEHGGQPSRRQARAVADGSEVVELTYGPAATLWRVNVGWARRAERDRLGFVLDTERGYWAKSEQEVLDDPDDPMSASKERVIPYVEDRRNALLVRPSQQLDDATMASLTAALKHAIQVEYQLEDGELIAEPLPSRDLRRLVLLYEAAEGGAGVLRRLVTEAGALSQIARVALELCHFDPDTGADRGRAEGAREDCEAACYDCLMSYSNQPDHRLLDRKQIRDLLFELARAEVSVSPGPLPRHEHLQRLRNLCDSELERRWLSFLDKGGYALPTDAQRLLADLKARPDFLYEGEQTAIFVDGPVHDYADVAARDGEATARLEDAGYTVIRFPADDGEWAGIVEHWPSVFGRPA